MCKMLAIDKNFGLKWSFEYSKIYHDNYKTTVFKTEFFYKVAKHLFAKNIMVFSNSMVFASKQKKIASKHP
jgi:hypothetical protein